MERVRLDTCNSHGTLNWKSYADLARQLGVSRAFICTQAKEGKLNDYLDRKCGAIET